MAKQAAAGPAPARVTRLRDLEDDVFDVAHNSLLRHSAELPVASRRQVVDAADFVMETPKNAGSTVLVRTEDNETAVNKQDLQTAVQATWDKANAMQDQAISNAVRSALRLAHDEAAREQVKALKEQEVKLRAEAEKANRRLWEIAAREKETAIAKAIENQDAEVKRLTAELESQQDKLAVQLEDAYHSVKGEVGRVLEDQHSNDMNLAVQQVWERAARLEATAVAAARKEVCAEADTEWEKRLALERLAHGEELRASVGAASQAHAEELQTAKDDLRRMRQEVDRLQRDLETERRSAREAESKAAKQQQHAVNDAVRAVEEIAKGAQERAVTRALAAAGVKPQS